MSKVKQNQLDQPILNSSMARQAILNSNFDVWQRGTSTTLTSGTTAYTADRWYDVPVPDGGTLPTLTRSRQTLTPGELGGSFYYSRLTTNGAGSGLGANSAHSLTQKIEFGTRYLCGDGKKVTVSFWAKSDIANKKIGVFLFQNYGTGGSPTSTETINGTNWTLTSTWTKYTHTFTTNTLASKTFGTDNNDYLGVFLCNIWGTDRAVRVDAGTTAETYVGSGNIDIAQVQLCAGDVALPFMPKSYAQELADCMRYYETSYPDTVAPGTSLAVNQGYGVQFSHPSGGGGLFVSYKVEKRTAGLVLTIYDEDGTVNKISGFTGASYVSGQSYTFKPSQKHGFYLLNLTANTTYTYFNWSANAEL